MRNLQEFNQQLRRSANLKLRLSVAPSPQQSRMQRRKTTNYLAFSAVFSQNLPRSSMSRAIENNRVIIKQQQVFMRGKESKFKRRCLAQSAIKSGSRPKARRSGYQVMRSAH